MAESNKMKEMPVNKLMIRMGIPMILSLSLIHIFFSAALRSATESSHQELLSARLQSEASVL